MGKTLSTDSWMQEELSENKSWMSPIYLARAIFLKTYTKEKLSTIYQCYRNFGHLPIAHYSLTSECHLCLK